MRKSAGGALSQALMKNLAAKAKCTNCSHRGNANVLSSPSPALRRLSVYLSRSNVDFDVRKRNKWWGEHKSNNHSIRQQKKENFVNR